MGCREGEPRGKAKPGRFQCGKCGAVSKKKKHVCKPVKIKKPSGSS